MGGGWDYAERWHYMTQGGWGLRHPQNGWHKLCIAPYGCICMFFCLTDIYIYFSLYLYSFLYAIVCTSVYICIQSCLHLCSLLSKFVYIVMHSCLHLYALLFASVCHSVYLCINLWVHLYALLSDSNLYLLLPISLFTTAYNCIHITYVWYFVWTSLYICMKLRLLLYIFLAKFVWTSVCLINTATVFRQIQCWCFMRFS